MKKVFITAPFYENKGYCIMEYFVNLSKLNYPNKEFFFVDNSKDESFMKQVQEELKETYNLEFPMIHQPYTDTTRKRQMIAYNKIRRKFLESDCDYMLIVESDVFPHKYTIELLMEHDKDVCSAVYYIGWDNTYPKTKQPCLTTDAFTIRGLKDKCGFGSNFFKPEQIDGVLREVEGGCGLGCILIKRHVLENHMFRFGDIHADTYFHEDLKADGIKKFVDTRIVCRHQPSEYPSGDF